MKVLLQKSALYVAPSSSSSSTFTFPSFQGQYFSGGNFRIYLLGNPVIWWSNLAFLATFLLMFFIAAIKWQRGYDTDEKVESKSKWDYARADKVNSMAKFNNSRLNFPEVESPLDFYNI